MATNSGLRPVSRPNEPFRSEESKDLLRHPEELVERIDAPVTKEEDDDNDGESDDEQTIVGACRLGPEWDAEPITDAHAALREAVEDADRDETLYDETPNASRQEAAEGEEEP